MAAIRYLITVVISALAFTGAMFAAVEASDPFCENVFIPRFTACLELTPLSVTRQLDALSQEPSTVVFGTSRSYLINPLVVGGPVVNFSTVYGNPSDVLRLLNVLDARQRGNIRRVIFLLDWHVFADSRRFDPERHLKLGQRLQEKAERFGAEAIMAALRHVSFNILGNKSASTYMHENGYQLRPMNHNRWFKGTITQPLPEITMAAQSLDDLKGVDAFLRTHDIAVDYVTSPFPTLALRNANWDRLIELRQAIADRIGAYSEMTYIKGLSDDPDAFADPLHLGQRGMIDLYAQDSVSRYQITREGVEPALRAMATQVQ